MHLYFTVYITLSCQNKASNSIHRQMTLGNRGKSFLLGEKKCEKHPKNNKICYFFLGGNLKFRGEISPLKALKKKTLLVYIVESDSWSVDTSQGKRGAKLVVKIESKPPTRGLKMFLYRP